MQEKETQLLSRRQFVVSFQSLQCRNNCKLNLVRLLFIRWQSFERLEAREQGVHGLNASFTFQNYGSLTGEFSHIRHPFLGNGLQWSVMYEANQAILTVEQHVPDQVSTLLLVTLGLLGLVTFRKQLVHKQS